MSVERGSDEHFERLAIRMLHKVCPAKAEHEKLDSAEHCPRCGIDGSDYVAFIVGDKGKPDA